MLFEAGSKTGRLGPPCDGDGPPAKRRSVRPDALKPAVEAGVSLGEGGGEDEEEEGRRGEPRAGDEPRAGEDEGEHSLSQGVAAGEEEEEGSSQ